jgi:hypothetical protein
MWRELGALTKKVERSLRSGLSTNYILSGKEAVTLPVETLRYLEEAVTTRKKAVTRPIAKA